MLILNKNEVVLPAGLVMIYKLLLRTHILPICYMNFREFDFWVPIDTEQMNGSDLSHSFPDLEIMSTESRAVKSRKEGSLGELNIEIKHSVRGNKKQVQQKQRRTL